MLVQVFGGILYKSRDTHTDGGQYGWRGYVRLFIASKNLCWYVHTDHAIFKRVLRGVLISDITNGPYFTQLA